jgi:cytochrome c oxidase cbb3-type subunit III
MRRYAAVLTASLVLLFAGCQNPPGYPPPAPTRPRDVVDFASLYSQNCAACHGEGGENGPATDLANPEYEALVDDATLRKIIANGMQGTLMPAFARSAGGTLTDKQVDVLVNGMRKKWQKPNAFGGATPPQYAQAKPGDAQRGEQAYKAHCAICHQNSPQEITGSSYLALVSDQALRTFIIAGRRDIGQPDWQHDSRDGKAATPLTSGEVDDIVTYLSTLRNPAAVSAASGAVAKAGR